jgi:hypothetical protein
VYIFGRQAKGWTREGFVLEIFHYDLGERPLTLAVHSVSDFGRSLYLVNGRSLLVNGRSLNFGERPFTILAFGLFFGESGHNFGRSLFLVNGRSLLFW